MKTLGKLFLVCGVIVSAAWPATITMTFDESSHTPTVPAGVTFQSGVLVLCEAFDATAPVCSGNNVSDVVQFAGGNIITYNSDLGPGAIANGAEQGIPVPLPNFGAGQRFVLEPVTEGTAPEIITYSPTPNDPGGSLVTPDTYVYHITSDGVGDNTPEPATMALLGAGLLAIGGRRLWSPRQT
jgi:hypothetical protein